MFIDIGDNLREFTSGTECLKDVHASIAGEF